MTCNMNAVSYKVEIKIFIYYVTVLYFWLYSLKSFIQMEKITSEMPE